jgi:hypothetical protein
VPKPAAAITALRTGLGGLELISTIITSAVSTDILSVV